MTIDDAKTVPGTRGPSLADGELGAKIKKPPQGWKRLAWLGPGFLWMVSAAGSGELLFTPRVGALYGYALLWALLTAVVLKWFINREIGRYTVCTGATVLEGFGKPVSLLKLAGAIEAAHIPVLAGLILYLNHRVLPADLRPSWPTFVVTALAGIFFALFAMVYLYQLVAPAG